MSEFETALRVLNEAFEADPRAVRSLMLYHARCNSKLADHPTVQVDSSSSVGALGLINGILEASCGRKVAAKWNGYDLEGFCEYEA